MTEDKLNYYKNLTEFSKHISIIDNKTSRTRYRIKKICLCNLKNKRTKTRERNNKKAREKRQKLKEKRLAI